jgi:hypothetical protein
MTESLRPSNIFSDSMFQRPSSMAPRPSTGPDPRQEMATYFDNVV